MWCCIVNSCSIFSVNIFECWIIAYEHVFLEAYLRYRQHCTVYFAMFTIVLPLTGSFRCHFICWTWCHCHLLFIWCVLVSVSLVENILNWWLVQEMKRKPKDHAAAAASQSVGTITEPSTPGISRQPSLDHSGIEF